MLYIDITSTDPGPMNNITFNGPTNYNTFSRRGIIKYS